jgi:drug/metabolite transporter (DMT)-like permease
MSDRPYAPQPDDPLRGILLVLAAMVFFTSADAVSKWLTRTLPPVEIAWIRYVVFLSLALLPLAWRGRRGRALLRARAPGLQVLRGLAMLGSALFFLSAIAVMPLAEATAINFISPAFITALSIPLLGEVVGRRRWAAVGVGLLGMLIIVRPGAGVFEAEVLLPILGSASWAFAVVSTRKMGGIDRPETTLIWSAAVGLLVLTAMLPFAFVPPTAGEVGLAVVVGVLSTGGHWLVVLAYRLAPASVLAPFAYVQLIFSTLLGLLVFGELPDGWTYLGAAVIAASGLYTAHRERVRARERAGGA